MKSTYETNSAVLSEVFDHLIRTHFSLAADGDFAVLAERAHVVSMLVRPNPNGDRQYPRSEVVAFRDRLQQPFLEDGANESELPLIIGGRVEDGPPGHLLQLLVVLPAGEQAFAHFQRVYSLFGAAKHVPELLVQRLDDTGKTVVQALRPIIHYQARAWLTDHDGYTCALGPHVPSTEGEMPSKGPGDRERETRTAVADHN